jgi:PAS domain S-box-containing protein
MCDLKCYQQLLKADMKTEIIGKKMVKRSTDLPKTINKLAPSESAAESDKFKHFFYNSLDLNCFATLDGYFEEFNDNFSRLLGYSSKEIKDNKFLEFVHPDDIRSTLNEMEKLSSGTNSLSFTNRYRTKSNTYRHLEWKATFNPDTKRIYAIARDITDKIAANTELLFQNEEKEKRAAELVVANTELSFQNEEKRKRSDELTIANKELAFQNEEKEKRATELIVANKELAFQYEEREKRAAELIAANKELVYQHREKERYANELIIANKKLAFQNEEKEKRAAELVIANKDLILQHLEKEKRAAELILANKELGFQNEEKEKRACELIAVNDALTQAEGNIRTLNEELELKVIYRTEQLEALNKELASFSYSVAHDLRAPLRAIHGNAKILEEDYLEQFDDEGIKSLNSIMFNSKRMGELIDDLLAFSRLGRKEITVSEINMIALVKSIKEELLSDERNIEFNLDALPPAQGDLSLIKQVWVNLISNAIKYSKYKPKTIIEIGADKKDMIVYHVKDNGAGFDMQYYDKLFGVFQRLHSQEEFEGTGIGLAIVQKIVHRHKGKVWAESTPNEGTCFYFSLPHVTT